MCFFSWLGIGLPAESFDFLLFCFVIGSCGAFPPKGSTMVVGRVSLSDKEKIIIKKSLVTNSQHTPCEVFKKKDNSAVSKLRYRGPSP